MATRQTWKRRKSAGRPAWTPPIEPILAKLADELPSGDWPYEPKWNGFRAIVFRGEDDVYVQSRDSRPLDRYLPSLHEALLDCLQPNCVVHGESIFATARDLDFDELKLRLHPAVSRVSKLTRETPSSFIAFSLRNRNFKRSFL